MNRRSLFLLKLSLNIFIQKKANHHICTKWAVKGRHKWRVAEGKARYRIEKHQSRGRGDKKSTWKLILLRKHESRMFWLFLLQRTNELRVMFQNIQNVNMQPQIAEIFPLTGHSQEPWVLHQWFPSNRLPRFKKKSHVLHLHLLLLLSRILYCHWYLGWHFNTHVKKLKAIYREVILQGLPSAF
jgi:hypothetical protein